MNDADLFVEMKHYETSTWLVSAAWWASSLSFRPQPSARKKTPSPIIRLPSVQVSCFRVDCACWSFSRWLHLIVLHYYKKRDNEIIICSRAPSMSSRALNHSSYIACKIRHTYRTYNMFTAASRTVYIATVFINDLVLQLQYAKFHERHHNLRTRCA